MGCDSQFDGLYDRDPVPPRKVTTSDFPPEVEKLLVKFVKIIPLVMKTTDPVALATSDPDGLRKMWEGAIAAIEFQDMR